MNILHHISFNFIFEIVINQKNPVTGTIVITILDFTYIWSYKIVEIMVHTE